MTEQQAKTKADELNAKRRDLTRQWRAVQNTITKKWVVRSFGDPTQAIVDTE